MSKRTYEEYIKNGCHPVGYNEPLQSYYFGQVSVDWLLDQITQLKQQLAEKEKDRDAWKRACELACKEAPMHCPDPPEYYNAQNEYGSDEPYYIQVSACEFSDDVGRCLECQMDYFYQQAKGEK